MNFQWRKRIEFIWRVIMIKFESVGVLAVTTNTIYEQMGDLFHGSDLFYGNTAESMNVEHLEINYNQESYEREYLCDFNR